VFKNADFSGKCHLACPVLVFFLGLIDEESMY